jgi:hypothetical protein
VGPHITCVWRGEEGGKRPREREAESPFLPDPSWGKLGNVRNRRVPRGALVLPPVMWARGGGDAAAIDKSHYPSPRLSSFSHFARSRVIRLCDVGCQLCLGERGKSWRLWPSGKTRIFRMKSPTISGFWQEGDRLLNPKPFQTFTHRIIRLEALCNSYLKYPLYCLNLYSVLFLDQVITITILSFNIFSESL